MQLHLVILAAGAGSRYGGLKQLETVDAAGHTLIDYSIYDALRAGFGGVILVVRRPMIDQFRDRFARSLPQRLSVDYVFQNTDDLPARFNTQALRSKPWGTGHAVLACRQRVHDPFAVINADDFYGADAFASLAEFLNQVDCSAATYANVTYALGKTLSETGAVSRALCECTAEGWIKDIVETGQITQWNGDGRHAAPQGPGRVIQGDTPVSMNMWGFTPRVFSQLESSFRAFLPEHIFSPDAEFLLPQAVRELLHSQQAKVKAINTMASWCGVTHPQDRARTMRIIQDLVDRGLYPATLWNQ